MENCIPQSQKKKFSNIEIENFPNVGKDVPGQAEEAFRTLKWPGQEMILPYHFVTETINRHSKENILRAVRGETKQKQIQAFWKNIFLKRKE